MNDDGPRPDDGLGNDAAHEDAASGRHGGRERDPEELTTIGELSRSTGLPSGGGPGPAGHPGADR
ncbi:hypothetical protein [Streptomyces sp. NPDC058620]|uniref:hypothetical protein n=1 Tax=Streptomyces sp. NPDC058620 TaxID=3346560 RepID=UPI00365D9359